MTLPFLWGLMLFEGLNKMFILLSALFCVNKKVKKFTIESENMKKFKMLIFKVELSDSA